MQDNLPVDKSLNTMLNEDPEVQRRRIRERKLIPDKSGEAAGRPSVPLN